MDSMVTARIAQEKKTRGNEVLASLGMTTSGIINDLYDYLIAKGQAPDLSLRKEGLNSNRERAEAYRRFLQDTVLPVPPEFWSNVEGDDHLLEAALEEKYGSLA